MAVSQNTRPTKAPNQPIAPVDYDQRFQDQFSNALRLYFAEIDNFSGLTAQQVASNSVLIWMDM